MPKRRRSLYRLVPAPLSRSREQIREHRAGELEPAPQRAGRSSPSCRTATGRIASTFEDFRNRARTRGGNLADGLASAGGTDGGLRELRKLGNTEAEPAGVGPPGAVDQPGGGVHLSWAAAASKADPASMAPAATKVSRTRRARRGRVHVGSHGPPCGELAADECVSERRTIPWLAEEGPSDIGHNQPYPTMVRDSHLGQRGGSRCGCPLLAGDSDAVGLPIEGCGRSSGWRPRPPPAAARRSRS